MPTVTTLNHKLFPLGQLAFDQLPGYIFCKDLKFNYQACTVAVMQLLGLQSCDEIIGHTDLYFAKKLGWSPRTAKEIKRIDQKVIQTGLLHTHEVTIINAQGNEVTLLTTSMPIHDQNGHLIGVITQGADITQRKQAELHLLHTKEKAEANNKTKTQFIANVSHDIRTPLTGIQGIAELLSKRMPDELQPEAHILTNACTELLNLLNDVISLAKIESGSQNPHLVTFDLKQLVRKTIQLFKPAAHTKGLPIKLTYDKQLPQIFVGNRLYLQRILLNLLGNAVKFTHKGHIAISVRKQAIVHNSDQIHIELVVEDTGIGIPTEKQQAIFGNFYRLKPTTKQIYTGSGLGLYITKQLIEQMGGKISVISQPNKGSQFIYQLSLKTTPDPVTNHCTNKTTTTDGGELIQSITQNLANTTSAGHHPPIKQSIRPEQAIAKILLVEDAYIIQVISTAILNELRCHVTMAQTGVSAITLAQKNTYSLILMDIDLPDISGLMVTQEIHRLSRANANTPIVALTAHRNSKHKQQCIDAGMDRVILKPLNKQQGLNLLKRYNIVNLSSHEEKSPAAEAITTHIEHSVISKHKHKVIDLDALRSKFGTFEKLNSIINLLTQSLTEEQLLLRQAFQQEQWNKLQIIAHRINGISSISETPRLKAAVRHLEKALQNPTTNNISIYYTQVQAEISILLKTYESGL